MLSVLAVIPATLVDKLSQDLNGRLCTIILFLRHVEIIDEDNATHSKFGTEVVFASLVNLIINDVLYLKLSVLTIMKIFLT